MIDFLASVAIELNPEYIRALLRRAELYEQTEKLDEALEDYKKVLELDPNQTSARQACMVSSLTAVSPVLPCYILISTINTF